MMADISSIDGHVSPWRSNVNRSPSQDFAVELAKEANSAQLAKHARSKESNEAPSDTRIQSDRAAEQSSPVISETPKSNLLHDSNVPPVNVAGSVTEQHPVSMVVQPVGITEALLGSRVYGLHLRAGAYLSELALSVDATSGTTFDAVKAVQSTTISIEEQAATFDSRLPLKTIPLEGSSPVDMVVGRMTLVEEGEAPEALPEAPSQAAVATVSAGALPSQWLERALRFTRQPDGSTAAWLRDYRVSEHEVISLTGSLLQEAKARGMVLGKIMLNGREVWTSRSDT
jgi:hypothetical protein